MKLSHLGILHDQLTEVRTCRRGHALTSIHTGIHWHSVIHSSCLLYRHTRTSFTQQQHLTAQQPQTGFIFTLYPSPFRSSSRARCPAPSRSRLQLTLSRALQAFPRLPPRQLPFRSPAPPLLLHNPSARRPLKPPPPYLQGSRHRLHRRLRSAQCPCTRQ